MGSIELGVNPPPPACPAYEFTGIPRGWRVAGGDAMLILIGDLEAIRLVVLNNLAASSAHGSKRVAVLPHKGLLEEPLVSIRARLRGRFSQIILLNIIGAGPRWRELM